MIFMALALAAAPIKYVPSGPPGTFNQAEKKLIIDHLSDTLLDADGARYRWPKIVDKTGYCAWVNAKNSYGAFTGYRPFYVIYGRTPGKGTNVAIVQYSGPADGVDDRVVQQMCAQAGYDLSMPPSTWPE